MAGNKYICLTCNATVWMVRKSPCPQCGGELKASTSKNPKSILKRCSICQKHYNATSEHSTNCGNPQCQRDHRMRLRRMRERRANKEKMQAEAMAKRAQQRIAPEPELLGPDAPPPPTHVCAGYPAHRGNPAHKCNVVTADRRCDKCRAMMKLIHGVVGSYDPSQHYCGGNGMDQVRI